MLVHRFLPLVALALNLLLLGSALAPDRRSHRDRVFAWLAAGLAVWNLGVFGLRSTATPATAFGWEWFLHLGVIPIPVLFFHYVLAFLDEPRGRAALVTGYALTAAFLGVSPTGLFISGVRDTPWGFAPATGPAYAMFVVHFQCYLVAGLVLLVRAYRRTTSSFKRNRTSLVIFGAVVSLLGGAMDFLRFLLDWESLYPFGIPANAVFGLALGIAIVRYQLMDVGALVKRMVLYLMTSVALAPILFVGLAELERTRVALLVPVLLEGEPAAIIVVGEKFSGEVFDPEELELLEALASQAAIALRNARLYGELGAQLDELQRTQAQLVQSAKLAAIGELAASVAHEINNPLTVVSGLSQLMQQTVPPDSHEAQRLSTIVGETQRAGRIVRDLLDFSRRREPRRERIRLHEAIQRALDLLEVRLKRRVDIRRLFDAELPDTMGDCDQLTQVFVNLVGNAADAMPQGGTLTVHTKVQEAEGGGAAIVASVSDTGGGIRPEVLDHIFEAFFTTKPEGQGTGLGLSVSLGIVHAHGGTIDVESQLGLGTTFRVVLPTAAG